MQCRQRGGCICLIWLADVGAPRALAEGRRAGRRTHGMAKMHVGAQDMNLTDQELEYLVRHGVFHADFNVDDMELQTLRAAVVRKTL